MTKKNEYTENDLFEMLRNTYPFEKGHCVLKQVRSSVWNNFGMRTADAISIGLWPSVGHDITGYEIKISYQDWLREIREPEKSSVIGKHCNYWYIVAPKGIIPKNELPEKWGLLVPARKYLKIEKPALKNDDVEPMTNELIANIFRRFYEDVEKPNQISLRRKYNEGFRDGLEEAQQRGIDDKTKKIINQYEQLKKEVNKFEEKIGIKLDKFDNTDWANFGWTPNILKWMKDHGHQMAINVIIAGEKINRANDMIQEMVDLLKMEGMASY